MASVSRRRDCSKHARIALRARCLCKDTELLFRPRVLKLLQQAFAWRAGLQTASQTCPKQEACVISRCDCPAMLLVLLGHERLQVTGEQVKLALSENAKCVLAAHWRPLTLARSAHASALSSIHHPRVKHCDNGMAMPVQEPASARLLAQARGSWWPRRSRSMQLGSGRL